MTDTGTAIIAKGDMKKGMRVRHYEITDKDFQNLIKGEEIYFYNGHEIQIYFKLNKKTLSAIQPKGK